MIEILATFQAVLPMSVSAEATPTPQCSSNAGALPSARVIPHGAHPNKKYSSSNFGIDNLTSDVGGEDEMLTLP